MLLKTEAQISTNRLKWGKNAPINQELQVGNHLVIEFRRQPQTMKFNGVATKYTDFLKTA